MSTQSQIQLCISSTGQEDDWKNLYESSFPQDERMSVSDLRVMMSNGSVLLHKTLDHAGNLLCFSIVTPMSSFSLLAYIATDPNRRSGGVGSQHMSQLLSTLKASYTAGVMPHHGLFLEIESTLEANLTQAEETERKRRLAFYTKLGANRLTGRDYYLPSYVAGGLARQGELLWFDYGGAGASTGSNAADDQKIAGVISEIYTRGYGLATTDATYLKVIGQFNTGAAGVTVAAGANADATVSTVAK